MHRACFAPSTIPVLLIFVAQAVVACGGTTARDTGDGATQETDSSGADGPDGTSSTIDAAPDATQSSDGDAGPSADGPGQGDSAADAAGDTGPDVEGDDLEIAALCDGIYGAGLRSFESCCSLADRKTQGYAETDNYWGTADPLCNGHLRGSLMKGRIAIDPAGVSACIAAVQSALLATPLCWPQIHYNDPVSLPPQLDQSACQQAVTGLQPVGGACFQDYECVAGLSCVGFSTTADGTCQAPMLGQPCGPTCMGEVTIYFDPFGPHPACAAGDYCAGCTCQAQIPAGGSCVELALPSDQCAPGFVCVDQVCSSGFAPAGAPCQQLWDCVDGTFCAPGADGGASVCTPRGAPGTACQDVAPAYSDCSGSCEPAGDGGGACVALCGSH